MPSPAETSDQQVAAAVAAYVAAEQSILSEASAILRRALPFTFLSVLRARDELRALVARLVPSLRATDGVVQAGIAQAAVEGRRAAVEAMRSTRSRKARGAGDGGRKPPRTPGPAVTPDSAPFDLSMPHGERAAKAIADDVASGLDDVRRRITRLPDDIYKLISPQVAMGQVIDNGVRPEDAQAVAWKVFTGHGVTGFVDKSGRNWSLSAYVEMSVRTAAARAFNDAHLQYMRALGIRYFTVPAHGSPCPLCWPWQGKVLTETPVMDPPIPVAGTIADAIEAGLWHPNCFPGFVPVSAPTGVSAADSRWYEGELVVIHTAAGNELSVTPNHPILTPEGWVAAGELVVGDRVISDGSHIERVDVVRPDDEHVVAPIGNVYNALRHARGVTAVSVLASAEQFHGDGSDADVEVVFVDSLLADGRETGVGEQVSDRSLFVGGVRFASLLAESTADQFVMRSLDATYGVVSGGRESQPLCLRHAAHAAAHRLTQVGSDAATEKPRTHRRLAGAEVLTDLPLSHAGLAHAHGLVDAGGRAGILARTERDGLGGRAHDAGALHELRDPSFADANGGRDLAARFARDVPADEVVSVERRQFAGHVYNLQTGGAWYTAGSIVVHNCRHTLAPFFPGITVLHQQEDWGEAQQAEYDASQKQRAIEREIRKAKLQAEYALTPEARKRSLADMRRHQARMRELIAQSGRPRESRREQPNLRMGKDTPAASSSLTLEASR